MVRRIGYQSRVPPSGVGMLFGNATLSATLRVRTIAGPTGVC